MFLSDFDYGLPAELIARYPTSERCGSRLLVVGAELDDRRFGDVPELFTPGDLLILNDTRVIRARLFGRKSTGGRVEILVERILADGEVLAQVRASKSPKPETKIILAAGVIATVLDRDDDARGEQELVVGAAEVDDVDAVAGTVDVLPHARVPPLGLVAEVCPGLHELSHRDDGRVDLLFRLQAS